MENTKNDTTKATVWSYLKKSKLQNKDLYDRLILFSVKPHDIVKYIERPEDIGKWPFDFVIQVEFAITQISKKLIIDFPKIEIQTEEDRVLSKILKKNSVFAFGTNSYFGEEITVSHVIAYMERDEIIYSWNSDFVLKTQNIVNKVKELLL